MEEPALLEDDMGWGPIALLWMGTGVAWSAEVHERIDALADAPLQASPDTLFALAAELAELREEARQIAVMDDDPDDDGPTEPPVDHLLASKVLTFSDDHRIQRADHSIVVLRAPNAVEWFDSIDVTWSPWLEERPEVHARVILADGTIRTLDPTTLTEGGAAQGVNDIYTTDRMVSGPLPPAAVGAVVEQWIVRKPKRSMSRVSANASWLPSWRPVWVQHFEVRAPQGSKLSWTTPEDADKPTKGKVDGLRTLSWAVRRRLPTEPKPEPTAWTPPELWRVSLGTDWTEVARDYAEQVADKDDPAGAEALVEAVRGVDGRRAQVAMAVRQVRDHIQYTGLEFGTSAIVPYTPAEALERGYGDCKDQATLLRTLLAEVGIASELALVSMAWPDRAHDTHPGLSGFDHVIVHVPDEDLWIDPTARWASLDAIPFRLEGRGALLVSDTTAGLVAIPRSTSKTHSYSEQRDVHLEHGEAGRFEETVTARGEPARWLSNDFLNDQGERDERGIQRYAQNRYGAEEVTVDLLPSRADQPSATLTVSGEAPLWETWQDTLELHPSGNEVFRYLQEDVFYKPDEDDVPYVPEPQLPYRSEVVENLHLPPGYGLVSEPVQLRLEAGDAVLEWSTSFDPETRVASARLALDLGDGQFTAEEWREVGRWARLEAPGLDPAIVGDTAGELVLAGRHPEAIAAYTALIDAHPELAWARSRRARALLDAGLAELARAEGEAAVELEPESSLALFDLGFIATHDDAGLESQHYPYKALARSAYGRALEVEPDNSVMMGNLALLNRRPPARTFGKERAQEAADEFDRWIKATTPAANWEEALGFLLDAGRYDRVVEITQEHPDVLGLRSYRLAALAMRDGVPRALSELVRIEADTEARRQLAAESYERLYWSRRYDLALTWLQARPTTFDDPTKAQAALDLLPQLQHWEDVLEPKGDPKHTYMAFFIDLLKHGGVSEDSGLLADATPKEARAFDEGIEPVVNMLDSSGMSGDLLIDVLLAVNEATIEGDPKTGQRLILTSPVAAEKSYIYMVGRKKDLRVYADSGQHPLVAAQVLKLIADGELEGAEQWYQWLLFDDRSTEGDDRGQVNRLHESIERAGVDEDTRRELVAAVVAIPRAAAVERLQAMLADPELLPTEVRQAVWFHAAGRCMGAVDTACAMAMHGIEVPTLDDDPEAVERTRRMLLGLGDPTTHLAGLPPVEEQEHLDLIFSAMSYVRLQRFEEALQMHERAVAVDGRGLRSDLVAAIHLYSGDAEKVVELLGRQQAPDGSAGAHHHFTMAAARAQLDDPVAARTHLQAAWTAAKAERIEDLGLEWWFVLGRMAETYGFVDVARDYYARVPTTGAYSEPRILVDSRGL